MEKLKKKIKRDYYCRSTCNLVYYHNKRYLLDLTIKENWLTKMIAETLFERRLLPVFIINDFEELNVKQKLSEICIKAFKAKKIY